MVNELKQILATYPAPVPKNRRKQDSPQALKVSSPKIANRSLRITAQVERKSDQGVILAQGGKEHGYAVHVLDGMLAFDVRVRGEVTRLKLDAQLPKRFKFVAELSASEMSLALNGSNPSVCKSPGLIPVQPKDELSLGEDIQTAAGNYAAPNPLDGQVLKFNIQTER